MGLFGKLSSRKKKEEKAAQEQQRQLEAVEAQKAAAAAAAAAQETARKEAAEAKKREKRNTEDLILTEVTQKQKHIEQAMNAIKIFEGKCQAEMKAGQAAQKKGNKREALRHAQAAKRFKTRIKNYETQVKLLEDQLAAVQDQGQNLDYVQQVEGTNQTMKKLAEKVDVEKVEDVLADAREGIEQTNEVQNAFFADANMNPGEDEEELLAGLNDPDFLGEEEIADPTDAIPSVPNQNPLHPAKANTSMNQVTAGMSNMSMKSSAPKTQTEIEDEELRILEADLS